MPVCFLQDYLRFIGRAEGDGEMGKSIRFWDGMAKNYDVQVKRVYSDAYVLTAKKMKEYLKSEDRVLDLGCGTGLLTVEAAEKAAIVDAVDISGKMIDAAREKAEAGSHENISFYVGDVFSKELEEGVYDVVMAFNLLYFLDDPGKAVRRIKRLLKPDGVFLSATDCLGEALTLTNAIRHLLVFAGFFPSMKMMKREDVIKVIEDNGFAVREYKDMHDSPPNLFVAAMPG